MIGRFSMLTAAALLSGTFGAIATAHADVTMESRSSVEGVGIMSVGNMSGTTKSTISGDRSRTDSDMQLKSGIMRMLAHSAMRPRSQIIRLDQGKILDLDLNKKQYTEETFEEMRAQLQKTASQTSPEGTNGKAIPSAVDESKCEWLAPKAEVKRTGQKASIAGFDAEEIQITASQPCKDKTTGAICEVALGLDEWLAPQFSSGEEAHNFYRTYAQKMGLDLTALNQDATARAQAMFSRYKGIWEQVGSKMQDMKGYAVRSAFTLAVGGEQCQNAQTAQQPKGDNTESPPTNPADLASQLTGKLAGAFFHKKADDTAAPASPPPVPPGTIPLITIRSELISVSTAAVSPDTFEVPPGFKKIAKKTDN